MSSIQSDYFIARFDMNDVFTGSIDRYLSTDYKLYWEIPLAYSFGKSREELMKPKVRLRQDCTVHAMTSLISVLGIRIVEAKTLVKSMLSSKNFKPSISTFTEVSHWLNILATELHLRLSESRDNNPGLWVSHFP